MSTRVRVIGMLSGALALTVAIYAVASYVGRSDQVSTGTISGDPSMSVSQNKLLTPVSFTNVTERLSTTGAELIIQGIAEPAAIVALTDRGEVIRQVRSDPDGNWTAVLNIPEQPMAIEAVMFAGESGEREGASTISIRGIETIFHIRRPPTETVVDRPAPGGNANTTGSDRSETDLNERNTQSAPQDETGEIIAAGDVSMHELSERATTPNPALILISSPGSPSRLIQSPFGGLPGSGDRNDGPLFMGPVDYDDSGGVIFSGVSSQAGRVRLFVANAAVGDTRVGPDGQWGYIASSVMPLGEYEIRAELLGDQDGDVSVSIPFERLPPMPESDTDDGALSVIFEPFQWQIRRSLIGGGSQSTVIVSPER